MQFKHKIARNLGSEKKNQPCFEGGDIDVPISNAADKRMSGGSVVQVAMLPQPCLRHCDLCLHFYATV